jgi:excisionase family DNA binding protein
MRPVLQEVQGTIPKLLLTSEEAAEALSLGRTFVYGLVARCELPSVKLGRTRRVVVTSIYAYVDQLLSQAG